MAHKSSLAIKSGEDSPNNSLGTLKLIQGATWPA
jgi:hypothetical protein